MNIEKIVAACLDKRRSESAQNKRQYKSTSHLFTSSGCYEPQNHSFQPVVNQIPKSIYKTTTKTECSRQEIIQRLYADRRTAEGKRAIQKLSEQEQQYKQNCTFQPQTNPHSKRILKTQCTDEDPFERLYGDAINKKKLSQSLNYQQINKENYSFQPETNYRNILNSETSNMKPIHQRIQEIVKQKRQRLKNLQQTLTKEQIIAQPKINEISEKIVASKEQFKKNILERMSGYIYQKRRKQEQEALDRDRNMMKQCTFKPQINNTDEIPTNFLTRQQQYLKRVQSKMTSRIVYNSFQPQINKISQILMRDVRANETMEDKINRLTNIQQKKQRIYEVQRQLYQQCTFQPQINSISKCISAKHVSHKCDHTPKQQDFQFKPKINKMSALIVQNIKSKRGQSYDQIQNKKYNLDALKMQMEYEQLKECTFRPKINYSKPKSTTNLSNVRGFDKFSKKIDKINQIKIQQKQRLQKLFQKQKQYKVRKSTTVSQFKLSKGYNTKQAVKQQIRQKFQKQCTFKPQIISMR